MPNSTILTKTKQDGLQYLDEVDIPLAAAAAHWRLEQLQLDCIRLDGDTQPRAELDPEVRRAYEDCYRAGVAMPPVIVFFDGKDYWLVDGFHRWFAARSQGASIRSFLNHWNGSGGRACQRAS
jgi:hypothetical protein